MRGEYINNDILTSKVAKYREQEMLQAKFLMMRFSRSLFSEKYSSFEEFERDCRDCDRIYGEYKTELANDFYLLASNILKYTIKSYGKPCFLDEEDQIQEGVMICFEKLPKFNPKIGKIFNYLTTCVIHHFQQLYRTNKNYHDLKIRFRDYMASREKLPTRRLKEKPKPAEKEPIDY